MKVTKTLELNDVDIKSVIDFYRLVESISTETGKPPTIVADYLLDEVVWRDDGSGAYPTMYAHHNIDDIGSKKETDNERDKMD